VDLDVSYQKAFQVLARSSVDGYLMQSKVPARQILIKPSSRNARLNGRFSSILSSTKPELTTAVTNINKSQKDESDQKVARAKQANDKGSVAEAAGTTTPNNL
jgi:hypothetical protein